MSLAGPKPRPKGVGDGQQVINPAPGADDKVVSDRLACRGAIAKG